MPRFNKTKTTEVVKNHQGGASIKHSPEVELVSVLATGLDTGTFYEAPSEREKRIAELVEKVGNKNPELLAKSIVYARSVMGQRSVTHVAAATAAKSLSGTNVGAKFFSKRSRTLNKGGVVYRLDDMLEILSYYMMRNPNKPIPSSMKKGFKAALESADSYELAKYQAKGKGVSLVDAVNLFHPKPSAGMEKYFKELVEGTLKQFNTAEDKNTASGQAVAKKVKSGEISKEQAATELSEAKAENWKELVESGKIGYIALLRNLRNIVTQASNSTFDLALELLTNEVAIRKSLVFPHQIDLAFEVLMIEGSIPTDKRNKLLSAVNTAYELAVPNLEGVFHGNTAVVFDTSASMTSAAVGVSGKRTTAKPVDKATLIAATLAKGIGADVYHFADRCEKISVNPLDTVNSIKTKLSSYTGRVGHGTAFTSIFQALKGYDRVFVISDMQGGDSIVSNSSYQNYIKMYGQPYVYAIDLVGYGTTMFKNNHKLINLFGYSKDIYEAIKTAEIDPYSILKEIEKIEL